MSIPGYGLEPERYPSEDAPGHHHSHRGDRDRRAASGARRHRQVRPRHGAGAWGRMPPAAAQAPSSAFHPPLSITEVFSAAKAPVKDLHEVHAEGSARYREVIIQL